MQVVKHAIISAAGIGSRLGLNMPKCLVKVNGRRIIDYQLELLSEIEDVRVVVGFLEDQVIDHVRQVREDVIFVRNSNYASTSTLQSIALAARFMKEPFLALDGDVIIEKRSFKRFLHSCKQGAPLIGVTAAGTEDAVFVRSKKVNGQIIVEGFQRNPNTDLEWTGIAYLDGGHIRNENRFVYELLEQSLPLPAAMLECFEVDTQADLAKANNCVSQDLKIGQFSL